MMGQPLKYLEYNGPVGVVEGHDGESYLVRCHDCGELHKRNTKAMSAERKSRDCPEFRPHNYVGGDPENSRLLRTYGITLEDYDRMYEEQGGGCAICGGQPERSRFCVDHDHKTNEARGLLCEKCNWGIGHFNDTVSLLRLAIKYLER
jgi:hypothetical protein